MTKTKLAYLAGLIDGDGSIHIVRRQKQKTDGDRARGLSFQLFIRIGGETEHLRNLRISFGGIGNLWVRKRPGQRHLAEWVISANEARKLLADIRRFLILKRPQANHGLAMPRCRSRWDATPKMRSKQEKHWIEMKRLNHKFGRGEEVEYGCRG